jgi:precorrin-3B methylase
LSTAPSAGSLIVVGTGIQLGVHLTPEARAAIEQADEVLYGMADALAAAWLNELNPKARSLGSLYALGKNRLDTYSEMVEQILASVRAGNDVCVALYGHPGVFAYPGHEAVARARAEGFRARMLPAISTLDCLVADLGIDPARTGMQSYEASDFLLHLREPDPAALLVLWQIGVVGEQNYVEEVDTEGLSVLVEYLLDFYAPEHEAIIYEASPFVVSEPNVLRVPLQEVTKTRIPPISTMVVPPAVRHPQDAAMAERLGVA